MTIVNYQTLVVKQDYLIGGSAGPEAAKPEHHLEFEGATGVQRSE